MYIASADFMTRNTERRVEVACPVYDTDVQSRIRDILNACLRDNTKARTIKSDGSLEKIEDGKPPFSELQYLIAEAMRSAAEAASEAAAEKERAAAPPQHDETKGFIARLKDLFNRK